LEAEQMSFSDETVFMYAKANVIRRRTVDYGLAYSYNKTAKPSIEWEPLPWALKQRLEHQFGTDFPQCACNEFIDHEAYIGPHHDKATLVGDEKREPLFIASISLGVMRRMVLTPPGANLKGVPITVNGLSKVPGSRVIELAPGSLILFTNAFNKTWKHSIPKDLKHLVKGKRISLTYRHF
jgi:alkylated DNA repair dioxygenase AlkB